MIDSLTFTINDNMSRETSGEVTILQCAQNSLITLCWNFAYEGKKVAQLIFLNDFYCPKEFLWPERFKTKDKGLKIKVENKQEFIHTIEHVQCTSIINLHRGRTFI